MKKILFVLFVLTSIVATAKSQNTAVYQEIPNTTTTQQLSDIQKNLQNQGMILKIRNIQRGSNGTIRRISIVVNASTGTVKYITSDFTKIIIKRNELDGLSVKAEANN